VIEHALALSPPTINRVALRIVGGDIALRRGDLASATAALASSSAALGLTKYRGPHRSQYYLPLARLQTELALAENKLSDALGAVEVAVDQYDLLLAPRYAWPLLVVGARACNEGAARTGRDHRSGRQADALVARLRATAAKMDAAGPVQQACRLTFSAEVGREPGAPADSPLASWDSAPAAPFRAAARDLALA
jgi:hypothetical protein